MRGDTTIYFSDICLTSRHQEYRQRPGYSVQNMNHADLSCNTIFPEFVYRIKVSNESKHSTHGRIQQVQAYAAPHCATVSSARRLMVFTA